MAKHRSHSVEYKRQVAQEFLAGETLHISVVVHNVRLATPEELSHGRAQADAHAPQYLA